LLVALKSGVIEIPEEHNGSTNRGGPPFVMLLFSPTHWNEVVLTLPSDAPVSSPFRRWPGFLRTGDTAAKLRSRNVRVFKCGDFMFAINDEQSGFVWH
jgi:hypothetical protein